MLYLKACIGDFAVRDVCEVSLDAVGAHSGRKKNVRTSKSQRPSMPIGEPLPPPPALPPTETDGHQLPSDR